MKDMGFIAMKGMAGGLIRDGFTAAAWMAQQEGVVPIWGVQREQELDQFLQCIREGAELLRTIGFRYYTVFEQRKPTFLSLE